MNVVIWTLSIYSILLIIGGVMGFLKAGSIVSLLMGLGSGLILGYCTWSYSKGNKLQCMVVLGVTALITLFFAYRLYMTHKIFPPAVMVVLGLIVLGVMYKNKPERC